MQSKKFYRRNQASAYVREKHNQACAPSTLAKLAVVGGGPKFYKAGRFPIYEEADLDAWATARLGNPVETTAQYVTRPANRATFGRVTIQSRPAA